MNTNDLPSLYLSISPSNEMLLNAFSSVLKTDSRNIDIVEIQETEYETHKDIVIEREDYKSGDFICELFFVLENIFPENITTEYWWELCKNLSTSLNCKVLTDGDYNDLIDVHEVVFNGSEPMKVVYSLEPEESGEKGLLILKEI